MEIMNKGLTVSKWGLTVWPKIPKIHQNLFGRSVQLAQQFCICIVKNRLHWSSLVREPISFSSLIMQWWKSEPAE